MHILISGAEQPQPAHYHVLRQYSTNVRDLPRDGASREPLVWDLRDLVLEGETSPVKADTVQRWLDLVYCRVDAARRVRRITDLDEARPLLTFADAVGASQVLIDDIGRRLADNPDLSFAVKAGEGQQQLTVKLALSSLYYIHAGVEALWISCLPSERVVCRAQDFAPHVAAFPSAVCSALESWLHLAGRLRMVPLCRALMGFVKLQRIPAELSIVLPAFSSIFSRRVLECMPRELLYEALVRDSLIDNPAGVAVEAEAAVVTVCTTAAASWFCKTVDQTLEDASLYGELLTYGSTSNIIHTTVGGPAPGLAPGMVKDIMAKAFQDPE